MRLVTQRRVAMRRPTSRQDHQTGKRFLLDARLHGQKMVLCPAGRRSESFTVTPVLWYRATQTAGYCFVQAGVK